MPCGMRLVSVLIKRCEHLLPRCHAIFQILAPAILDGIFHETLQGSWCGNFNFNRVVGMCKDSLGLHRQPRFPWWEFRNTIAQSGAKLLNFHINGKNCTADKHNTNDKSALILPSILSNGRPNETKFSVNAMPGSPFIKSEKSRGNTRKGQGTCGDDPHPWLFFQVTCKGCEQGSCQGN